MYELRAIAFFELGSSPNVYIISEKKKDKLFKSVLSNYDTKFAQKYPGMTLKKLSEDKVDFIIESGVDKDEYGYVHP